MQERLRQLRNLIDQLPMSSRLVAGLLVVIVVGSAAYIGVRPTSQTTDELFGGRQLSAGELDRMEAAFSTAGLSGWKRDARSISVPTQEKFSFVAALADQNALPENSDEIFFNTMKSSTFYESSQQRAMRMKYATQREAAMIVQAMTGIETATVRYVDVPGKGFGARKTTRANVAVRATDNRALSPDQVTAICDTVAFTIGADSKDVVVTDLTTVRAYHGGDVVRRDPQSDQLAARQQELASQYSDAIRSVLSMIDGAVINVQVQLTPPKKGVDQPATLTSTTLPNQPTSAPRTPSLLDIAANRRPSTDTSYGNKPLSIHSSAAVDQRESTPGDSPRVTPPATLTHVSGTVSIPKSHFRRIWLETYAPKIAPAGQSSADTEPDAATLLDIETETIANVRQLVQSCLPVTAQQADAHAQLVVTSHFDVRDPTTTAETQSPWPAFAKSHWREIGIGAGLLLIVAGIGWYRNAHRSDDSPVPTPTMETAQANDQPTSESKQSRPPTSSLHEELSQRVQQDPAEAASALNAWLRDAA